MTLPKLSTTAKRVLATCVPVAVVIGFADRLELKHFVHMAMAAGFSNYMLWLKSPRDEPVSLPQNGLLATTHEEAAARAAQWTVKGEAAPTWPGTVWPLMAAEWNSNVEGGPENHPDGLQVALSAMPPVATGSEVPSFFDPYRTDPHGFVNPK
jgi:hypothetical protein